MTLYTPEAVHLEFVSADGEVLGEVTVPGASDGVMMTPTKSGKVASVLASIPDDDVQGWPVMGAAQRMNLEELEAGKAVYVPPLNISLPDDD